jgi:hypothetical protein
MEQQHVLCADQLNLARADIPRRIKAAAQTTQRQVGLLIQRNLMVNQALQPVINAPKKMIVLMVMK